MPIFSHPLRPYHDNHTIVKVVCLMAAAFLVFITVIAAAVLIGTLI